MAFKTGIAVALAAVIVSGCQLQVEGELTLDSVAVGTGDAECPNGGQEVLIGVDDNDDGSLAGEEIQGRTKVCFPGVNGGAGGVPDVAITATPGGTCTDVTVTLGTGAEAKMASACVPPSTDVVMLQDRFIDPTDTMFANLTVTKSPVAGDPTSFGTLYDALDFLRTRRKSGTVTINIEAGTWDMPETVTLRDLDGVSVDIVGDGASPPILEFDNKDGIVVASGYRIGTLRNLILRNSRVTDMGLFPTFPGIRVEPGSRVALSNVEVRNFLYGIEVVSGDVTLPGPNQPGNSVTCNPQDLFSVGIWIRGGGTANLDGSTVSDCANGPAIWVMNGSSGAFNNSTASTSRVGFSVERGSFMEARDTQATGNQTGYLSANKSMLVIERWPTGSASPGAGNATDVVVRDGSLFRGAEPQEPAISCGTLRCDATGIVRGCTGTVQCDLMPD
ncbi:MAG: right-handed parallel beta-helix repeat-containing protein [Myxococcota bacterium]